MTRLLFCYFEQYVQTRRQTKQRDGKIALNCLNDDALVGAAVVIDFAVILLIMLLLFLML